MTYPPNLTSSHPIAPPPPSPLKNKQSGFVSPLRSNQIPSGSITKNEKNLENVNSFGCFVSVESLMKKKSCDFNFKIHADSSESIDVSCIRTWKELSFACWACFNESPEIIEFHLSGFARFTKPTNLLELKEKYPGVLFTHSPCSSTQESVDTFLKCHLGRVLGPWVKLGVSSFFEQSPSLVKEGLRSYFTDEANMECLVHSVQNQLVLGFCGTPLPPRD